MPRESRFRWYAGVIAAMSLSVLAVSAQDASQPSSPGFEVASLREDVRQLKQGLADLGLRVEQLEKDNSVLEAKANRNYVTLAQLNAGLADLQKTLQSAMHEQKRETLHEVSVQLEKLARQTQAAIDAVARGAATRPTLKAPSFSNSYPKEGISYTVQKGDTLTKIAERTGSRVQDIVNANKIADPTRLQVGQTLFIPQHK